MNGMPSEKREAPDDAGLVAAAKLEPNGWVYDVDWPYTDDQRTPPEAIRGAWQVGPDGRLSGLFEANTRYRPIGSCTRLLKPYVHAAAATNRNQWIVEIDPRGEKAFPEIPEAFIRGWWLVDSHGKITDKFRPNSKWQDD